MEVSIAGAGGGQPPLAGAHPGHTQPPAPAQHALDLQQAFERIARADIPPHGKSSLADDATCILQAAAD
eukprot:15140602-Heterocapsa_arctica.AAC.1